MSSSGLSSSSNSAKQREEKDGQTRKVPQELVPGDSIAFQRPLYKHFGMYSGRGKIIHLVANKSTKELYGEVKEEDFWTVVNNCNFERNINYGTDYKPIASIYKMLKKARSQIGITEYKLTTDNCEHFVNACRYGKKWSRQVAQLKIFLSSSSKAQQEAHLEEMDDMLAERETSTGDDIVHLREKLYRLEINHDRPEAEFEQLLEDVVNIATQLMEKLDFYLPDYNLNFSTLARELSSNPNDYVRIVKEIEEWGKERILTAEGHDYVKILCDLSEKLQTPTEDYDVLKNIAQSLLEMPEICSKEMEDLNNKFYELMTCRDKDKSMIQSLQGMWDSMLTNTENDSEDSDDKPELEKLILQLIKEPDNHVSIVNEIVKIKVHRMLSEEASPKVEELRVASEHISQKDANFKELTRLANLLASNNGCFGEDTRAYRKKLSKGPDFLDMDLSATEIGERVKKVHKFSRLMLNALSHRRM